MKPTSAPDSSFPSRPRLPAEDRRSQLIAAALEIFAEQGFHGTPTRELARHAGVSEADWQPSFDGDRPAGAAAA